MLTKRIQCAVLISGWCLVGVFLTFASGFLDNGSGTSHLFYSSLTNTLNLILWMAVTFCMFAWIKTLGLLWIAVFLAAAGLVVPAHLRSVDATVIKYAGTQGASPESVAWEALNAADTGPALLISEATLPLAADRAAITQRVGELTLKHPQYAISGGPAPYFEEFLDLAQRTKRPATGRNAVISVLLPRSERTFLSEILGDSSNSYVNALLQTRNLRGLLRMHPADHPAGAPYDAGLLTLSLLTQGGCFKPSLANEIGQIATQAAAGNPDAVHAMEDIVIATLSIATQLDYRSLASLAARIDSPWDWAHIAALFRIHPDRIPQTYAALYFAEDTGALHNYIAQHPDTADADLDFALEQGPAAVQYLLATGQPIYRPTPRSDAALTFLGKFRPGRLVPLTHNNIVTGQLLKFALLLAAGLTLSLFMGAAWRAGRAADEARGYRHHNPAAMARHALLSIAALLTLWIFIEPDLLKSHDENFVASGPRIEFAVADTLQSLRTPVKAMQDLNQVTLLMLALFFIIQLVIYCFCLIKLREIARQQLDADLKIKLLENEETLFDLGLYVGLGGTVLSLIMVAVGIVEASLMAAYASTLFGILFVAMFKVLHLRPYRRKLIVEADTGVKNIRTPSVKV